MPLNIKDPETEALVAEVAARAGSTKTAAVRDALRERLNALERAEQQESRVDRIRRFLVDEAWPQVPVEVIGHAPSRTEREAMLGYGPEGV